MAHERSEDATADVPPRAGQLSLLVAGEDTVRRHRLPPKGTLVIGRGERANIRVQDAWVSRRHAILHVGERLRLEDLGSANGTRVDDRRLPPGSSTEVTVGSVIELGATMLVVHEGAGGGVPRTPRSKRSFDERLEQACSRGRGHGHAFGLVSLRVGGSDGSVPRETLEAVVASTTAPADVAQIDGERVLLLLTQATALEMDRVVARIARHVRFHGGSVASGAALFPRDGSTPVALMTAARTRMQSWTEAAPRGPLLLGGDRMLKVHALLARVAAGSANAVLLGEVGVGKGLLAERIHEMSPRGAGACIELAAAVLEESTTVRVRALIEAAAGGTLVLEEPRALSLPAQARLVEAIRTAKGDIRIVTLATTALEHDVRAGLIAPELATALAGAVIEVPPLRERTEEIRELARDLLERACRLAGRTPVPAISQAALQALECWLWPGNIRELATTMFRAAVAAKTDTIELADLPPDKMKGEGAPIDLRGAVNEVERERVELALTRCGGNQSRAAKLLGVARNTLIARMRAYGIAPKRPRG